MPDLFDLADDFLEAKVEFDVAETKLNKLKTILRDATAGFDEDSLPDGVELDGGTFYINACCSDQRVTVSKSDENPVPPLVASRFLAAVGAEEFFRFIRVEDLKLPSKAFRADEWVRAVETEETLQKHLDDSLGATPKPRAWSVGVS